MLVEVYDNEVVIKRRNFTAERWIGDPWIIDTTDNPKDNFQYTDDRDQEDPYFEDDATIGVGSDGTTA